MTTETILAANDNELSKWHVSASGRLIFIPEAKVNNKPAKASIKIKVAGFLKDFFSLDGFNAYNF